MTIGLNLSKTGKHDLYRGHNLQVLLYFRVYKTYVYLVVGAWGQKRKRARVLSIFMSPWQPGGWGIYCFWCGSRWRQRWRPLFCFHALSSEQVHGF